MLSRKILVAGSFAVALSEPALATTLYTYTSVYDTTTNPFSFGGASISDDGTIAFQELLRAPNDTENPRTLVALPDDTLVVLGSDDIGPLFGSESVNVSDNGRYVAVRTRSKVGNTFGIWRYDLQNPTQPVLIAKEGDPLTAEGPPSDLGPIGSVRCPCRVDNDGRVMFSAGGNTTTGPEPYALVHGDGGALTAFAFGPRESFDRSAGYDQNNQGLRAAVIYDTPDGFTNENFEFIRGLSESVDQILPPNDGLGAATTMANPIITDQTPSGTFNFGVIATRAGVSQILARTQTQPYGVLVDDAGQFDRILSWSLNENDDLAFWASLDFAPNEFAVYTGPDPVKDRVIGEGDVLFGKVVRRVGFVGVDAMNATGELAVSIDFEDGTESVVRVRSLGQFLADISAQMTVPVGGSLFLETDIATPPPAPMGLGFNIDVLTGGALFEVFLGGQSHGRFGEESITDGMFRLLSLDRSIFGSDGPLSFGLRFLGDGETGTALRIDDLGFVLSDGSFQVFEDFEEGYFDNWLVDGTEGSTAFLKAVGDPLQPVPLPGSMLFLAGAVFALSVFRRQWMLAGSGARYKFARRS